MEGHLKLRLQSVKKGFNYYQVSILLTESNQLGRGDTPSWVKLGGTPPLDFYKFITPKAFDLVQVICDHRQVG